MNINGLEIKTTEKEDTKEDVKLANELMEYANKNKDNKRLTDRLAFMGNDKLLNNGFVGMEKSDNIVLGDYVVVYVGGKTYMSTKVLIGTMRKYFSSIAAYDDKDSTMILRHLMKFVIDTPLVEEDA